MSNSPTVQKAIKEALDELSALTTEEFNKLLSESTEEKQFQEFDTVRMLRES